MKAIKKLFAAALASSALMMGSCVNNDKAMTVSGLDPTAFDSTINNIPVKLYQLKNANGVEVCITNFGGRVVSIAVPDRNGKMTDVVLGFDNLKQYTDSKESASDFGASIGRYANRIGGGKITIDGKEIQLNQNDGENCLHGGSTGWQYQPYQVVESNDSTLKLKIVSPDGDNGFPGEVTAITTYRLTADNALDISFEATTTAKTVINMTNHCYFNLNGDPANAIVDNELYINADKFTPTDKALIPTGEMVDVKGTPMDFTTAHLINDSIANDYEPLKFAGGYDHNWCLNTFKDGKGDDKTPCATVYSPKTGIMLTVFTSEPGLQVYTGNFQPVVDSKKNKVACKHGIVNAHRGGICLESQKFPDSPNKKDWVSPLLAPGEKYTSHLVYKFSVK